MTERKLQVELPDFCPDPCGELNPYRPLNQDPTSDPVYACIHAEKCKGLYANLKGGGDRGRE